MGKIIIIFFYKCPYKFQILSKYVASPLDCRHGTPGCPVTHFENPWPRTVVLKVDVREIDPYKSVTLTVYEWNRMDPLGQVLKVGDGAPWGAVATVQGCRDIF